MLFGVVVAGGAVLVGVGVSVCCCVCWCWLLAVVV